MAIRSWASLHAGVRYIGVATSVTVPLVKEHTDVKDFLDGAVVPFEWLWMLLGF